jgi:DNA modification methylase
MIIKKKFNNLIIEIKKPYKNESQFTIWPYNKENPRGIPYYTPLLGLILCQ